MNKRARDPSERGSRTLGPPSSEEEDRSSLGKRVMYLGFTVGSPLGEEESQSSLGKRIMYFRFALK